jgi:hypothetical protein
MFSGSGRNGSRIPPQRPPQHSSDDIEANDSGKEYEEDPVNIIPFSSAHNRSEDDECRNRPQAAPSSNTRGAPPAASAPAHQGNSVDATHAATAAGPPPRSRHDAVQDDERPASAFSPQARLEEEEGKAGPTAWPDPLSPLPPPCQTTDLRR